MSQDSHVSSVPSELIEDQDAAFIDELNQVDQLYFGWFDELSAEEVESIEYENESETEIVNYDSDSDLDFDDEQPVNTEPTYEDNSEYVRQAKFRNETCCCKEFYGQPCSTVFN